MSVAVKVVFALVALVLWWGVPSGAHAVQCPAYYCDSIGTLGIGDIFSDAHSVPRGPFSDIYNFSLSDAAGTVALGVTNVQLFNFLNIDGLGLALYAAPNGLGFPLAANGTAYSLSLPAANYSAVVSGTAVGTAGGVYAVALHAVPLPAAAVLMIGGLGMLGAVVRRRT